MNVDDDRVTDSSPNCDRNGEENGSTEMAGVLLSLQSLLKQLVEASKAQTKASNNLREDILLQPDPNEEDKDVITDGTPNLLDLTKAINQLLDASNGHRPKSLPDNSCPDEGTNNDFLDSLTQALLPNSKKSPEGKKKSPEKYPDKINFPAAEIMTIDAEIAKLFTKEVLLVTNRVPDGFISNIFIRPKKDGAFRMILNLKPLKGTQSAGAHAH